MPGHRTHDILGVLTSAPFGWGAYVVEYNLTHDTHKALAVGLLMAGSHIVNTLWLSPDLDLHSEIHNRWGPLKFIWGPYKSFISHRSNLSHSAFGGILRWIYLLVTIALFWLMLAGFAQLIDDYLLYDRLKNSILLISDLKSNIDKDSIPFIAAFLLGAASASYVHVLADRYWIFKESTRNTYKHRRHR